MGVFSDKNNVYTEFYINFDNIPFKNNTAENAYSDIYEITYNSEKLWYNYPENITNFANYFQNSLKGRSYPDGIDWTNEENMKRFVPFIPEYATNVSGMFYNTQFFQVQIVR